MKKRLALITSLLLLLPVLVFSEMKKVDAHSTIEHHFDLKTEMMELAPESGAYRLDVFLDWAYHFNPIIRYDKIYENIEFAQSAEDDKTTTTYSVKLSDVVYRFSVASTKGSSMIDYALSFESKDSFPNRNALHSLLIAASSGVYWDELYSFDALTKGIRADRNTTLYAYVSDSFLVPSYQYYIQKETDNLFIHTLNLNAMW